MLVDPVQHVRNRVDAYWTRQWQRRLLAASQGLMADNVANNGGDMVHDTASESIAAQSANTRFSRQGFINAAYTMGDQVDGVVAMGVHSMTMKQMSEQGDVEDVLDKDGNLLYQAYMGRRLVMDDQMTAVAGATDGGKYTSILFGSGAWAYGNGMPKVPTAVDRVEESADGGGIETLWSRKTWILHPFGYKQEGTPAKVSFNLAELRLAAQWERQLERKLVPFAFYVHN